ncbi:MAG: D-alanyl-D-alanine carboxypeptidase family protein [Cyanobacteria bacterium J06638_22]
MAQKSSASSQNSSRTTAPAAGQSMAGNGAAKPTANPSSDSKPAAPQASQPETATVESSTSKAKSAHGNDAKATAQSPTSPPNSTPSKKQGHKTSDKRPETASRTAQVKPSPSAITVTVKNQPSRQPWNRWRWALQFIWLAVLAAGWGVLTHFAIAQLPPPQPVNPAQAVLQQVAPVVERVFHGIYAWEITENLAEGGDRTYRQRFGHLPYAESPPSELMVVSSYTAANEQRFEQMEEAAGLALLEMIDSARRDGIWLVPISGFRDYARQDFLFESKVEQLGSPESAAFTVAPPGYSEHHTGMAVDLADGLARALDLSLAFGDTDAYRWLSRHANRFGFELSFPPENPQGISYEPWHWRYVGTDAAIATFSKGRATLDLDREHTLQ